MIYDRIVQIAALGTGSSPLDRRLTVSSTHYCADVSIYERTWFQWQAAGKTIDRMIQFPQLGAIDANCMAIMDGHVYKIQEAREETDDDGRKVWRLSLSREADNYDIFNT